MTGLGKAFVVERGETSLGGGAYAHMLHREGCPHTPVDAHHGSYNGNVELAMAEVKKNLYSSIAPCPHCCGQATLKRVG